MNLGDMGLPATKDEKVGAGLAPDKATEMRIRAELEAKWALEKKLEDEKKKSARKAKKAIV